jgi:hypothetical protein
MLKVKKKKQLMQESFQELLFAGNILYLYVLNVCFFI